MENRFFEAKDDDIDFFMEASTSKNTKKGTQVWIYVFNNRAKCRGYNEPIYAYKVSELNEVLKKFYVEVRKKDGSSYEPNCFHKPPFENYDEKGFKNAK